VRVGSYVTWTCVVGLILLAQRQTDKQINKPRQIRKLLVRHKKLICQEFAQLSTVGFLPLFTLLEHRLQLLLVGAGILR